MDLKKMTPVTAGRHARRLITAEAASSRVVGAVSTVALECWRRRRRRYWSKQRNQRTTHAHAHTHARPAAAAHWQHRHCLLDCGRYSYSRTLYGVWSTLQVFTELRWTDGRLRVVALPTVLNSLFVRLIQSASSAYSERVALVFNCSFGLRKF